MKRIALILSGIICLVGVLLTGFYFLIILVFNPKQTKDPNENFSKLISPSGEYVLQQIYKEDSYEVPGYSFIVYE